MQRMIEFCEKARNDQVSPAVMQSTIPLSQRDVWWNLEEKEEEEGGGGQKAGKLKV